MLDWIGQLKILLSSGVVLMEMFDTTRDSIIRSATLEV
jgi:hypothetical protein